MYFIFIVHFRYVQWDNASKHTVLPDCIRTIKNEKKNIKRWKAKTQVLATTVTGTEPIGVNLGEMEQKGQGKATHLCITPEGKDLRVVQKWFEEHNNKFEVLTWFLYSPDLNLIENLQYVLDN